MYRTNLYRPNIDLYEAFKYEIKLSVMSLNMTTESQKIELYRDLQPLYSFTHRSSKNKIYIHETLKFRCRKPIILHTYSTKCVNCEIFSLSHLILNDIQSALVW